MPSPGRSSATESKHFLKFDAQLHYKGRSCRPLSGRIRVSNNSKLDFASHVLGVWTGLVKLPGRHADRRKTLPTEPNGRKNNTMPEVIFNGPEGRLEGRYQPGKEPNAPIAIVLHPHPQFGGTMNNQIVYNLFYMFAERGFAVLRFNSRGVGRSQGMFDHGIGELSDAAAALDWLQVINRESRGCWIAGFSFGAWIGMQLLMRRPEVEGFISVSPPENLYDFSFLAPCPSSGLIIHGDKDRVAPPNSVQKLVDKLKTQKGIVIEQQIVEGANHFFEGKIDELTTRSADYLDRRREEIAAGGGR